MARVLDVLEQHVAGDAEEVRAHGHRDALDSFGAGEERALREIVGDVRSAQLEEATDARVVATHELIAGTAIAGTPRVQQLHLVVALVLHPRDDNRARWALRPASQRWRRAVRRAVGDLPLLWYAS
ncbi:MAG TPA: hypothetical protein VFG69_20670 [Nannocystaceae bacterium]|nr:hypothetical protein [Nannocystaceae bacterium]